MKSLIKKYMKCNLIMMFYINSIFIFFFTILVSVADDISFLESLIDGCLMGLGGCLFWLIVLLIKILFFILMINYQEKEYNVKFDSELVTGVLPYYVIDGYKLYMSKDWIICSCNFAFHYKFIKKIRYKCIFQKGNKYYAVITTNKGFRFKVNILNTKNYKYINKWIKEKV